MGSLSALVSSMMLQWWAGGALCAQPSCDLISPGCAWWVTGMFQQSTRG